MANTIKERLKIARNNVNLTQQALADLGGVSLNSQARYETTDRKPDAEYLSKVWGVIDVAYVLAGDSQESTLAKALLPAIESGLAGKSYTVNDEARSYSVTRDDFVEIPFYKVDISAGHGNHVDDEEFEPLIFRRDSEMFDGLNPDDLVGGHVGGDSMLPLILPDSDILIDKTDQKMSDGKIYVFNADEHLLVKKIVVTFDGYIARSLNNENNENPDIALTKEKIETLNIVGRARITLPFRRI